MSRSRDRNRAGTPGSRLTTPTDVSLLITKAEGKKKRRALAGLVDARGGARSRSLSRRRERCLQAVPGFSLSAGLKGGCLRRHACWVKVDLPGKRRIGAVMLAPAPLNKNNE